MNAELAAVQGKEKIKLIVEHDNLFSIVEALALSLTFNIKGRVTMAVVTEERVMYHVTTSDYDGYFYSPVIGDIRRYRRSLDVSNLTGMEIEEVELYLGDYTLDLKTIKSGMSGEELAQYISAN